MNDVDATWKTAAIPAVLGIVVLVVMVAFGDAGLVVAAIAGFPVLLLAGILALTLGAYAIRFGKWHYYLRALDVDVGPGRSLVAFLSGLLMAVTPGKVGEIWKSWLLEDATGTPPSRSAPAVFAERVTDVLGLALLGVAGLTVIQAPWHLVGAVVVAIGAGIVLLQWRSGMLGLLDRLGRIGPLQDRTAAMRDLYESSAELFRPTRVAVALAFTLPAWALEGGALWLALTGLGVDAPVLLAVSVFGVGSVVGALSFLPGGLGAAEAGMVGLLLTYGVARPAAVGATLIVRAGTLWFGALLGAAVFVGVWRTVADDNLMAPRVQEDVDT